MSLLTHLTFFETTKLDPNHGDQEGYVLTPSSRLLIKSELPNLNCEAVFGRLNSLVDVGGGTGIIAQIVFEAFPCIKCTIFDLPHVVENLPEGKNLNVVENLPEGKNLNFVGGDMFQSFPSADAFFFKVSPTLWFSGKPGLILRGKYPGGSRVPFSNCCKHSPSGESNCCKAIHIDI
ncbi:hypothetical protein TEA_022382 [Camellia sinensis var. sinensis]|uniref:O-methyltransferase C-terminal domain-containing protein n=1 Tax=Camellia sinensis var. sinensis TaxID=542762 RepID=A0A4S4EWB8_CAMSN|nr:hypothetical protein TEA_022382 [Camellia sinensis var. sinensis]